MRTFPALFCFRRNVVPGCCRLEYKVYLCFAKVPVQNHRWEKDFIGEMSVDFWWNEKDKEKQKNYIVTPKCTGLGLNPVLRGGKPTRNRLSHGTACGFKPGDGGLFLSIYVHHRRSQKGMSRDEWLPSLETYVLNLFL